MLPLILVTSRAGPFLLTPGEAGGSLSFLPGRGGCGAEPEPKPIDSSRLSRCSGLQHNRIWEIGADTFSQLSSLQAL